MEVSRLARGTHDDRMSLCQQMNVVFSGGVATVNFTDSKKFPAGDLDHFEGVVFRANLLRRLR